MDTTTNAPDEGKPLLDAKANAPSPPDNAGEKSSTDYLQQVSGILKKLQDVPEKLDCLSRLVNELVQRGYMMQGHTSSPAPAENRGSENGSGMAVNSLPREELEGITGELKRLQAQIERILSFEEKFMHLEALASHVATLKDTLQSLAREVPTASQIMEARTALADLLAEKNGTLADTLKNIQDMAVARGQSFQAAVQQLETKLSDAARQLIGAREEIANSLAEKSSILEDTLKNIQERAVARGQSFQAAVQALETKLSDAARLLTDTRTEIANLLAEKNGVLEDTLKTIQEKAVARGQSIQAAVQVLETKLSGTSQQLVDTRTEIANALTEKSNTLADTLKNAQESSRDEFVRTINEVKQQLFTKIDDASSHSRSEVAQLRGTLNNYNQQLATLQSTMEKQGAELASLSVKLAEKDRLLETKEGKITELETDLSDARNTLNTERAKNNALQEEWHREKQDTATEIRTKDDTITSLKNEITHLENTLGEQKKKNEWLDSAFTTNKKVLEGVDSELAPYRELRASMLQSDTFRELAHEHGIDNQDELLGLFACVRSLGESYDFLLEVYEWARKKKEETMPFIPLGRDEKKVYAELNSCYRKLWNVDFDVFQQPGGQEVLEDFRTVPFDRDEAKSLENPRDTDKKYSQEVYVPLLMKRSGDRFRSALVKVGNVNK